MGRYIFDMNLFIMSLFFVANDVMISVFCYGIGAIELSILADYYGREIGAYDIQTSRCDLYGQVIIVKLWNITSKL